MATKQRLIVCLDGTWNNRDNSTNVLHHFAIVREGDVKDRDGNTITQKKYYHEGVGTGVLDGISGGAFGFGLEDNVRDGYNWLVQHYGGESDTDEIYIFGFSRGAYTARSLVGLIGRCGLLRRRAPITVSQLWENYCILGREHEERGSFNDMIFGKDPSKFRQISDLICDPWQIDKFEEKRTTAKPANPDRVPGQRVDNLNNTEQLLVRWSRRVRITYLGLYDTVGAVGFDALAIPGLRSKLALHHNMRPTTLIQSCRHALAMDAHRRSFNHTPFIAYMGHADSEDEQQRDKGESQADPQQLWRRSQAMWWRKIEQRWFVGAHSNIGGGYPDNRLAQRSFAWVLEGAKNQGLVCEMAGPVPEVNSPLPPVRDSFAEFAKPFWTMIIRGKRNYRPIDPEPESQASRKKSRDAKDELPPGGFTRHSINEQIDPSVFAYWKNADPPANLAEYATRKLAANKDCENAEQLRAIKAKKLRHLWFGEGISGHVVLVLWAALAAVGLAAMHTLVFAQPDALPLWLVYSVAFGFVLVDWAESRANFSLAVGGSSPRWRAFLDSIYWTRALGVTLLVLGVVAALTHLWALGWRAAGTGDPWTKSVGIIRSWWLVPVLAGAGIVVANLFDRASPSRHKSGVAALAAGPLTAIAAVPVVIFLACLVAHVFAPVFGFAQATGAPPRKDASFAGLLLLLQIAVAYFLNAFHWVGQPMTKANLGQVTMLQRCLTPAGVKQCLERWRAMLVCSWLNEDATNGPAARRMREILRESLWRDIIGFIPVYSVVLGFGLWFGAKELGWELLAADYLGIPLWLLLPLIAAVSDYIEGACHLRYLALHSAGREPGLLFTVFSFVMTWIKNVAFFVAAALTLAAIFAGSWRIARLNELTGWRGTLALLFSVLAVLVLIVIVASAAIYRLSTAQKQHAAGKRASPRLQN